MTNRQIVIWNLVAFAVIQFILEVVMSANSPVKTNVGAPVIIQYIISWWIIKSKINEKDKKDLIKYTWIVSICVFVVRVILGVIWLGLIGIK